MGYREPTTDSIVHIYNRGPKKLPISRGQDDLFRLLHNLFYFNNAKPMPATWSRDVARAGGMQTLVWPEHWEPRVPIVSILAFTLMPNHLHLILKELVDGGVSKFMHRAGMSYSKFINEKYDENGSLFQGPYKSRRIDSDTDLRNLLTYVMVKNPFELYPGGLMSACQNFDDAYDHALAYPFTSLSEYTNGKPEFLDHALLDDLGFDPAAFKEFSREVMLRRFDAMRELDLHFTR